MPACDVCGATLATVTSLRRHVNSQHQKSKRHSCECGREFLDPAGASRCKASHFKKFGCPVNGCDYTTPRKDSVKQHMRRRHSNCLHLKLEILTLPPNSRSTSPVSSASTGDISPPPGLVFMPPPMPQAPFGAPFPWPLQPDFYYPVIPPEVSPGYHK